MLDQSFINVDARSRAASLRHRFDNGEDIASELRTEVGLYKFYHHIDLIPGVTTPGFSWAPQYQEAFSRATNRISFSGRSVIDVGCRDGAMLFAAERRNAVRLVGIDNDPSLGLANLLAPFSKSKIAVFGANIYDVTPDEVGTFDIVICCGLLYHLRYPVLGLRRLADLLAPRGTLILETGILDAFEDFPIMFYPLNAQSPYEGSSPTFFNLAGLDNALGQVGLDQPTVLDRFYSHRFDPATHFPKFAATYGSMTITRTILATSKNTSRVPETIEPYFEGRHTGHTL